MQTFTRDQVKEHNKEESLYIVVDSSVYDLTDFVDAHPGGAAVLLNAEIAGQDATDQFYNLHRHSVIQKYESLKIGSIQGEKPKIRNMVPGDLSHVPYGEPSWLLKEFDSPYFNDGHRKFQRAVRKFIEEEIKPIALECEDSGERPPAELFKLMGKPGIEMNAMRLGPGKHLHGRVLVGDIKGEDYSYIHEMIVNQELARPGPARGFGDGLNSGMSIGLPPVINFCKNEELRQRVIKEVFSGEKNICLAITEAFAGSDVRGIQTTAKLSADGSHYIVNGSKKWITNGNFSYYFTTAVKTGENQYSVLLIPRIEGVETKLIKTAYSTTAGTAYVTFDNVKIPADHLLGVEGRGLPVILSNFSHERWMMCCSSIRMQRNIYEECMKWANQRKVFGKLLIEEPVIRQKLGRMITLCESSQSWLEQVSDQMDKMNYDEQNKYLNGRIALLKMFATRCEGEISDLAVSIFGGRALTKGGMGNRVENHMRTFGFNKVLGGEEGILADLGVKQAWKNMPQEKL
ncbi:acyl-CoA dehydrogenase [Protomyces lactucae-debilis]|uniref:Acyl-CoA dehydrogenase n=1 Tax=Protomyces lactucae-debilis TaxID=2754530 RepID=A0A1Y2FUH1_PROLT|nr:acyl-CoA dehydrogenase [Protomyces lactucae-debilis]ORY87660.1 acyl-CoA dehydrogenase [Protomyces lactucae-debilis]